MHTTQLPIGKIVWEHTEELCALWARRQLAVNSSHYKLVDIARLDERLEAHLDGLRIASGLAVDFCQESIKNGDVFPAAILAFDKKNQIGIEDVFQNSEKSWEFFRAVISALGWLSSEFAESLTRPLWASTSTSRRRICIAASAIHRHNPGQPLLDALSDDDHILRARAMRAVGELGLSSTGYYLEQSLSDSGQSCRFWAAWSLTLLTHQQSAIEILTSIAESDSPFSQRALQLVVRRMDIAFASEWRTHLASNPQTLRTAIIATGALGEPSIIPWLIENMNTPEFSRVAGEAFTMITGVDIAYEDLDCKHPPDYDAGPTEDPNDDNVDLDPDENLPWPDPKLIAEWWHKHQSEFQPNVRYILGKPITIEWCEHVLRYGRQRQRAAAALELSIRQPGTPLFNVAAPGFRQKQLLGLPKRP